MLIDSHAHLDTSSYDADREEVISRALSSGVRLMLEIAGSDVGKGSLEPGIALAEKYPFIYAAVGLHPHEASIYTPELESHLVELAKHPKVIGWGEIGLDYYYDNSPRDTQRKVFSRQIELARDAGLPVIIHTRDAEDDTISILKDYFRDGLAEDVGIIHCFTGTRKLADAALELGFLISFSGVLTFKTAEELRLVAASVPKHRLLVETDCPFLAPIPYRGKRNEPSYVVETAKVLAGLQALEFDELASVTTSNFLRLFRLSDSALMT